jgi:hypothetical protein
MIDLRFKPLPKWQEPRGLGERKAAFKMNYQKTLNLLEYELRKLDATGIIIEAGFESKDIRNDGWPRRDQIPKHPGVVLYYNTPVGLAQSFRFPSGTYSTYEANVHAIALTLQSLRAIDRYGVTLGHQQYIGFMLPAPSEGSLTAEDAAKVVSRISNAYGDIAILHNFDVYRQAYRAAAALSHPDVAGASNEWNMLQSAKRILDLHHGQAAAK